MAGSSDLTVDQQDWYEQRFGVRFLSVQENHVRPSRRVRRALKHGAGSRVTANDVLVYLRQQELMDKLTAAPLAARPT